MAEFATFGQELYFEESIRAIESFFDDIEPDHLSAKIASTLQQPSEATRLRVASKIVQRCFKTADGKSRSQAFLKLVKSCKSESNQRDLLYWRAARTDGIIAALAAEVFYPYFVLNTLPKGYDEETFRMANTATLFADDKVISSDFAVRYAKETWGFDSARTVTLALRIMKQAWMLESVSVKLGRRHVLGYYPQPHLLQPEVFAYCLYEEFMDHAPTVSLDRIHNGDCVKLFFVSRLHADSLLRKLAGRKLVEFKALPGGKHIRFMCPNLDALVYKLTQDSM
ncbi:MAG: hypothetical protein NTU88_07815 [Armatimonadetes bacterium]|nr:hypothetical protein [Armatimonadota bacterium]